MISCLITSGILGERHKCLDADFYDVGMQMCMPCSDACDPFRIANDRIMILNCKRKCAKWYDLQVPKIHNNCVKFCWEYDENKMLTMRT
jgi:hypothetical protein